MAAAEHYFTENPTSEVREIAFDTVFRGHSLRFVSVSGVFSFEPRVDKASALLLEAFFPSGAENSVLDMGCGFGPIGLCLKAAHPELALTLTDINRRAVAYAGRNAAQNRREVEVVQGDLYGGIGDRRFGDIVCNPPFAAGKAVNLQLIARAREHLAPGGALWLTAFHNKGGASLKKAMGDVFGNVTDVEKRGGIRVYRAIFDGAGE
jgi:16S rRNA G1207 methylase RsmC